MITSLDLNVSWPLFTATYIRMRRHENSLSAKNERKELMIESLKTTKNLRDVVKSSTTKNSCQSQINVKRQIVQFTRRTRTYSIRGNEFHTLKTLFFSICAT